MTDKQVGCQFRSVVVSDCRARVCFIFLVTRASRLCGGNGIGLGGEESTTWKPSRLQGVGPMGMPADDPQGKPKGPTLPCPSYN